MKRKFNVGDRVRCKELRAEGTILMLDWVTFPKLCLVQYDTYFNVRNEPYSPFDGPKEMGTYENQLTLVC